MSPELLLTLLVTFGGQAALLTDKTCGNVEAELAPPGALQIKARCYDEGADRVVQLWVTTPGRARTRLDELALGFCGEIVGATAPTGWEASVVRRAAAFGRPAMVQWRRVGAHAPSDAEPPRNSGFSVSMKPGWRQSLTSMYRLAGFGGAASGSPHDCGDWPR